jgi:hypothetical protein
MCLRTAEQATYAVTAKITEYTFIQILLPSAAAADASEASTTMQHSHISKSRLQYQDAHSSQSHVLLLLLLPLLQHAAAALAVPTAYT